MAEKKTKRKYTARTLKILFGSSSVCAFPGCTTPIIDLGTGRDKDFVAAQICHIHSINPDGPRWKPGLTEEYLNSPENLILLCHNHHAKVDCRDSKYSAEVIKRWRQDQINGSKFVIAGGSDSSFVDEKIEDETNLLRKSRFFAEYDKVPHTLKLAESLTNGNFSGGTNEVKCKSLAWCVRLLVHTKELGRARDYLEFAEELDTCPEIRIAEAFMASQKGGKDVALGILGRINAPISRSAALMIVAHHDGSQKAVRWMEGAGIDITDLDPDGKYLLLMCQSELSEWESAEKSISALTNEDFIDSPILFYAVAMAHLLRAVPGELGHDLFNGLPFDLAGFPLASNQEALKARRLAHHNFIKAKEAARQLGCFHAAEMNDEYALWLELRDLSEFDQGKKRLEDSLRDYKSALRLVRFGLQFDINLDLEAVEQEIERQIVLNGGITYDAALARFAIVVNQETPESAASYIARYYDELVCHISKKLVQSAWIGALSHAGLLDEANETLDFLVREKGVSDDEKIHLQEIINEAGGVASVKSKKEQFKKTDSLGDLAKLVEELEAKNDWSGVCEYGAILFARTSALSDAERLAQALNNAQKSKQLLEFLKSNETFVEQSETLQIIFCWALYYEGMLQEARSKLEKLDNDWGNPHYRRLQIVLAISMGDWHFLSGFVANEFRDKDNRSPQELIYAAQLAVHLNLLPAKELIFAAANRANNDATVLAAAYFLASRSGLEGSAEVSRWISKAAALSSESGPVKMMALQDIFDQQPEWRRQESEIQKMLISGGIPMLLAAQGLNKSLIHLMSFPALTNLAESDPRLRVSIPAYSGNQHSTSLSTDRKIGVDVTTLLTLSFLDILDDALDAFDTVYIPHAALRWLFGEKQQASFHQPSRIKDAHRVRDLISTGVLEEISPSATPDSDLSHKIGEGLALLITEAEKREIEDSSQHIVVTTFPVSQVGSLMKEEVDLTSHEAVLSSCQSVVKKLRQKGQITADEAEKACAYLKLHEKPWPNQPEIAGGATLYLDDLAVHYFLHLGILDKLHAAGFKPIISSRKVSETNNLISYGNISDKIKDVIERIRSVIHSRIKSGKVKVGRIKPNQSSKPEVFECPTIDVTAMSEYCDAIIVDDRFINQHPQIADNSTPDVGHMQVFSSLNLIDALVAANRKTPTERLEYRTRLRQAGYFFVPVTEDELKTHLDASATEDGRLIETSELKAIRENILCARMSDWLQLPQEGVWLGELLMVFVRTLQGFWKADIDFPSARIRSNWIIDQMDLRGWAHSFGKESGDNIARIGFGEYIRMLIRLPTEVPQEVLNEYWSCVEEKVFIPIKEECPDLYSQIVKWQREQVARISDMYLSQEGKSDE